MGIRRGIIFIFSTILISSAEAGWCTLAFQAIAHQIGFKVKPDLSAGLSEPEKISRIERLLPTFFITKPELARVLFSRFKEISPERIERQVSELPRAGFWFKRAEVELFHLNTLLQTGELTHPSRIERYIALASIFEKQTLSSTSAMSIANLKRRVQDPNTDVALSAVIDAGGVSFILDHFHGAELSLVANDRQNARQILELGLKHESFRVRAAARRGLIQMNHLENNWREYTQTERSELVEPLRMVRRQNRVPLAERSFRVDLEPDAILFSTLEMGRLPTHILRPFLDERNEIGPASRALSENRTLKELEEFAVHENWEVRRAAIEGLWGRYEKLFRGKLMANYLREVIEKDPQEEVRLAAIEVLGNHPDSEKTLNSMLSRPANFNRIVLSSLELAAAKAVGKKLEIDDNDLLKSLLSGAIGPQTPFQSYSSRRLEVIRTALLSTNPEFQKAAVRGLKGRTDLESIVMLGEITGINGDPNSPLFLNGKHFSAEIRAEALVAANDRNHPIADQMFQTAIRFDDNSDVYRTAVRLTDELSRNTEHRGLANFRVYARTLNDRIRFVRKQAQLKHLTPDEQKMDDHARLMEAASNTYALPSLNRFVREPLRPGENESSRRTRIAKRMVSERELFLQGLPLGYELVADLADATTSGLKLYYLKPDHLNPNRPTIISVAGTEKWLDWLGNVTWGTLKRETPVYRTFLSNIVNDLMAGRKIQITGHSLGGGIAQYLAYDALLMMKRTLANKPGASEKLDQAIKNIEVVTWNAFGVGQVLRKDKENYDDEIIKKITDRATHYRTPFDIVSKFGEPLGKTATLPFTGWWGITSSHSMPNVQHAGISLGGLDDASPIVPWLQLKPVSNSIANLLAPYGRRKTKEFLEANIREHFEILLEAKQLWLQRDNHDSVQQDEWLDFEIRELVRGAAEIDLDLSKEFGKRWQDTLQSDLKSRQVK